MKEIIITADGSHSLRSSIPGVTYHSTHGAIRESMHIYIDAGLHQLPTSVAAVNIFEMGFGTGLNALLTLLASTGRSVYYEAAETDPVDLQTADALNYAEVLHRPDLSPLFWSLHSGPWNRPQQITSQFCLHKRTEDLLTMLLDQQFHLVYFDAFDPQVQPGVWTEAVFEKMYGALLPGGLLLTYCSKVRVRQAMQQAGFLVEKLPGPPGKREIVRATKPGTFSAG